MIMMEDILPLQRFFNKLQEHPNYDLGVDEYFALLEVIQKDPGFLNSYKRLFSLCRLLWFKPGQSLSLFEELFKKFTTPLPKQKPENLSQDAQQPTKDEVENIDKPEPDLEEEIPSIPDEEIEIEKEESNQEEGIDSPLYLNIGEDSGLSYAGSSDEDEPDFNFVDRYFPWSEREIQQQWRFLQKPLPGKNLPELDVPRTIEKFTKNPIIIEPVYLTRKKNQAQLLTFIDSQGSMLAFRQLALDIAQSAQSGAGIQNQIYYFQNVPTLQPQKDSDKEDYVFYTHPALTRGKQTLTEILIAYTDPMILIISDAGATRSHFNYSRVEATEFFLQELYQHTLKIIWLNPMPQDRWLETSAEITAQLIPMYEANVGGLKRGLKILRGKLKPQSVLLYPNLLEEEELNEET